MTLNSPVRVHSRVFRTATSGGGETGARLRSIDWTKTSLGPMSSWPEELQVVLDIIYHSRMPMFIWWGANYIQFYNDAFTKLLSKEKQATAFGQKGPECWPEFWDVVGPQLERVYKLGQATTNENQLFKIERNGRMEETYWSYGYSPIFLGDGTVGGALALVGETTELVNAERSLKAEREKLYAMLMQSPTPMCTLEGPEHIFTLANQPYMELAGRTVLGMKMHEAFPEEEAKPFIEILDRVYRTGEPYIGNEIRVFDKFRKVPLYLNIQYHPVRNRDESIMGISALIQDVTEQVTARRIVQKAKESAEAANEAKSFFLANMSHEIRTPLGAILGFTELLKASDVTAEDRDRYLNIITRNGRALSSIIDDVLDLSKIEAGKIEICRERFNIAELISDVLEMFSEQADGKELKLQLESSKLPGFQITSDPVRVRQILVNLIGNAVKFTSQGSIVVHGSYEMLGAGDLRMNISISDTGKGLAREQAEKLFQPFAQAEGTSAQQYGGTGLGLALSRKLARALGGDVSLVRAEQEKGCTFCVEFIATKEDNFPTIDESNETKSPEKPLKGMRILVVDDSPDSRHLIKLLLSREGARVEQASGGEQAIRLVRNDDYDAVLMDIQMPGIDGYETLAQLRNENFRKPVFALTAYAMTEDRKRALQSGFSGHIPKPINSENLVETLLANTRRLH